MAIEYAAFIANPRYAIFATDDPLQQGLITATLEDATEEVNPDYFTCKTEKAILLLAAHMLTLNGYGQDAGGSGINGYGQDAGGSGIKSGNFGQVSSLSLSHGSQSASFKTLDGSASDTETEWLKRSPYGLAYLRLKSKRPVVGFVI